MPATRSSKIAVMLRILYLDNLSCSLKLGINKRLIEVNTGVILEYESELN